MDYKFIKDSIKVASKYINLKQYDKALEFVNKALAIDPTNTKAHLLKEKIAYLMIKPTINRCSKEFSKNDYFALLITLEQLRMFDDKLNEYLAFKFRFDREQRSILKAYIKKELKNKNYENTIKGINEYKKKFEDDTETIEGFKGLFFISLDNHLKTKNYSEANIIIEKILELDPGNNRALNSKETIKEFQISEKYKKEFVMVDTYIKNEGYDRAREILEAIIEKEPDFNRPKRLLKKIQDL